MLRLTPSGKLSIDDAPTGLGDRADASLRAAFDDDDGAAIVLLATSLVAAQLSPQLAFARDIGKLLLRRTCATPDLSSAWPTLHLEPSPDDLSSLVASAPPFTGAERLDTQVVAALFDRAQQALRRAVGDRDVVAYLARHAPAWSLVGRVCFHLAENKASESHPFAFLVTFSHGLSEQGKPRHLPLGRALTLYAKANDRPALVSLLAPIHRAAERVPLVRALVDSEQIYHPLAWTPADAYRFLQASLAIEEAGVVVRLPAWWSQRTRPRATLSMGSKRPSGVGQDALLDFSIEVCLDGEPLTRAELRSVLSATEGLSLLRGRWVEVDGAKLKEALERFEALRAEGEQGLSLARAMRLVAGATSLDGDEPDERASAFAEVRAGPWLERALAEMRAPGAESKREAPAGLATTLRPYQQTGFRWLSFVTGLGLGACLADDMGLGKTVQVIALLLSLAESRERHLLVVPASLLENWRSELSRFAPSLRVLMVHPSLGKGGATRPVEMEASDVVVTSYGMLLRAPWLSSERWGLVVLDEAQAIKNPSTRQSRAARALDARARVALTGTPIENRLGDLWSLFDFLCPGLLGPATAFRAHANKLERGEGSFAPLRALVQPYVLRRLKTDRSVIADLPDKTEMVVYCGLSRKQAALYQQAVDELGARLAGAEGMARRGLVLAALTRLKQICNHPSQWLGDEAFDPADSGKLGRLAELCEPIAERQERALVFTQFREMTGPLSAYLARLFGAPGLVLHGETPVAKRKQLVDRFQRDDGPPFMVLSLKAGGTGLNLTAASHVLHFDRWWNPAVEDQATDRAFRIGQKKNVLVHKLVCRGTVEEKIDAMLRDKRKLSREVLSAGAEVLLTEMSDAELLAAVSLDLDSALGAADG